MKQVQEMLLRDLFKVTTSIRFFLSSGFFNLLGLVAGHIFPQVSRMSWIQLYQTSLLSKIFVTSILHYLTDQLCAQLKWCNTNRTDDAFNPQYAYISILTIFLNNYLGQFTYKYFRDTKLTETAIKLVPINKHCS